jgi:hypothetical protein
MLWFRSHPTPNTSSHSDARTIHSQFGAPPCAAVSRDCSAGRTVIHLAVHNTVTGSGFDIATFVAITTHKLSTQITSVFVKLNKVEYLVQLVYILLPVININLLHPHLLTLNIHVVTFV